MVNIYIDDLRPHPEGWVRAYDYNDAIQLLIEHTGNIGIISFDHDLGFGKTGYDIAKWIEENAILNGYPVPREFRIHSANTVGRINLQRCFDSIKRYAPKK